jgi:hypothetical protein
MLTNVCIQPGHAEYAWDDKSTILKVRSESNTVTISDPS